MDDEKDFDGPGWDMDDAASSQGMVSGLGGGRSRGSNRSTNPLQRGVFNSFNNGFTGLSHLPSRQNDKPSNHIGEKEAKFKSLCKTCTVPKPPDFRVDECAKWLATYPDVEFAKYILRGISIGFPLGFQGCRATLSKQRKNLKNASNNTDAIFDDLIGELEKEHIIAVDPSLPKSFIPLGVVPKDEDKWRVIRHCSYPHDNSLNDFIPDEVAKVVYPRFGEVVELVMSAGKNGYLAKIDLKSAYRQIPVDPTDWELLGYSWHGQTLIDTRWSFGVRSACLHCQNLGETVIWITNQRLPVRLQGKILNYMDDFFCAASKKSDCKILLDTLLETCEMLGVKVNDKKVEGPLQSLKILGYWYDTRTFLVGLDAKRRAKWRKQLLKLLNMKGNPTRKQLESIVGKLEFGATVVWPAKAFIRRIRDLMYTVSEQHHHVSMTKQAKLDIRWWLMYIDTLNGVPMQYVNKNPDFTISTDTDACNDGIGAYCEPHWFSMRLNDKHLNKHISWKELFAVAMAFKCWGHMWSGATVLLRIDNKWTVSVLVNKSSHNRALMSLLRYCCQVAVTYHFRFWVEWIPTNSNPLADALSRFQIDLFKQTCRSVGLKFDDLCTVIDDK